METTMIPEPIEGLTEVTRRARRYMLAVVAVACGVAALAAAAAYWSLR